MEQSSHVTGAIHPPLLDITIGGALELAVGKWRGDEALVSVHQGVRLTWAELAERVDRFATGMLALTVEPGVRVGLRTESNGPLSNSPQCGSAPS